MTTGGGAPFGASVVGAAALVPFIATRAIVTARTTTSATAARAAGIRSKLVRAGAVVMEADIWFLQKWGSGAPPGRPALRRSGLAHPPGRWCAWVGQLARVLAPEITARSSECRGGRHPCRAPAGG